MPLRLVPGISDVHFGCMKECPCDSNTCGCNEGFCKLRFGTSCRPCPCKEPVIARGRGLEDCAATPVGETCAFKCEDGYDPVGTLRCMVGKRGGVWERGAYCIPTAHHVSSQQEEL